MMRQLQRILLIVLGLALGFGAHGYAVASADGVTGLWRDDGSILWVQRVDDTLHAQLIALRPGETHYGEDEQTSWPIGSPRRDDNNPDPNQQDRLLMGMQLLSDYQFTKGVWQGEIYDPGSGNTYSSTMKISRKGDLQMRGYIGIASLGRTVTYQPFDPCLEHGLAVGEQFVAATVCSTATSKAE